MRKITIIMAVAVFVILWGNITHAQEIKPEPEFIGSEELHPGILENRNGRMIIERMIGIVVSPYGDGKVLNPYDPEFNYIYYDIGEYEVGDIVITYLVYNPENNYDDDIIQRSDWVVGNIFEYDIREIPYIGSDVDF